MPATVASSGDVSIEPLYPDGATALCCAKHRVRIVVQVDTADFASRLTAFLDDHRGCLAS